MIDKASQLFDQWCQKFI